jgi:D-serine deaminase-like pyridoxal phosphate-dependent protein
LSQKGFDSIRVAYPACREVAGAGVCEALIQGKRICLTVDCSEHVRHLDRIGKERGVVIPLCMDLDVSLRVPGILFGVCRSPISTPDQAITLWRFIQQSSHVRLAGLIGYEAQVAGLSDHPPGHPLKNRVIRALKRRSIPEVRARRAAVVRALLAEGCALEFVNGGGTGSVETTREDPVVTEVTVGSGFFSPTLFDHYDHFRHWPAAGFGIEIVRQPRPGVYTCQGGGYVASGAAGRDKLPTPYLPEGARLIDQEGAGEVQTPIAYAGQESIGIGDPILFRHSKAGELCERFKSLLLVSQGQIVDEVPTYRGDGQCFV